MILIEGKVCVLRLKQLEKHRSELTKYSLFYFFFIIN